MRRRPNANPLLLMFVIVMAVVCAMTVYRSRTDSTEVLDFWQKSNAMIAKIADVEIVRNTRLIKELRAARADNRRLTTALEQARSQTDGEGEPCR